MLMGTASDGATKYSCADTVSAAFVYVLYIL